MSGVPDYTLEETLDFKFTTRQFSTGAPFAWSTGAVEIYEDNSLTQITAAETLTLEFDGVTGLHNLRIAATAANGFENGKSYHCVASAGSVDSVSVVGEVVQQFSIGRSAAAVDLANGTDGLGAIKTDTAAVLVDTGTTLPATLGTPAADVSADIAAVKVDTAATLVDTAEIGTAGAGLTNIDLPNQTMDITGSLSGSVGSVTGAVGSVTGNVGGSVNSLNTQAKADVNAEMVDVLETDTHAEASGVPAATASLKDKIVWLATLARNKITQTATTQTLRNDADGADVSTSTVSDDATTFTRGEWS